MKRARTFFRFSEFHDFLYICIKFLIFNLLSVCSDTKLWNGWLLIVWATEKSFQLARIERPWVRPKICSTISMGVNINRKKSNISTPTRQSRVNFLKNLFVLLEKRKMLTSGKFLSAFWKFSQKLYLLLKIIKKWVNAWKKSWRLSKSLDISVYHHKVVKILLANQRAEKPDSVSSWRVFLCSAFLYACENNKWSN